MKQNEEAFKSFFALTVLKALALLAIGQWLLLSLSPDEAQYWVWSRDLDWGYYSKPPGIAWQIALTTFLTDSHDEWAIRLGALLWSAASSLLFFFTARKTGLTPWRSFWAALILALSPLAVLGNFAATTDVGMLFFWIGALYSLGKSYEEKKPLPTLTLGLWILGGALFKWAIYWIYIPLLFWPSKDSWRHLMRLAGSALISSLALLPSLYWNFHHHFATFKHVLARVEGGREGGEFFFFEFFGSQLAIFSPFFFMLLFAALRQFWLSKKGLPSSCARWHAGLFMCFFSSACAISLWGKLQANWFVFIYPSAALCIGYFLPEGQKGWFKRPWSFHFKWASALTVGLIAFVLSLPKTLEKMPELSYKAHPFQQCDGWSELQPALIHYGFDPQKHWLFSDSYQMTALLSYYSPQRTRAFFFNLKPTRRNHFSFDEIPEENQRKDAYFVVAEKQPLKTLEKSVPGQLKRLQPFFKKVQYLGSWTLSSLRGEPVKSALIFKAKGYLGDRPEDPQIY